MRCVVRYVLIGCLFGMFLADHPAVYAMYNGATGEDELILVPTAKEVSMGASIAKSIRKRFKPDNDPLIQQRIKRIGERLAAVSDRQDLVYHFEVLEGDMYNAFAVPGGFIFMFAKMDKDFDDDMVAAVLAHEVAHVAARHSIKRFQGSIGATLLMILTRSVGRGDERGDINEALGQLFASYSREDELLADRLAIKYVREAGFDPHGVLRTLVWLQKDRKEGPLYRSFNYQDHPYLSIRISRAQEEITGVPDFNAYINIPHEDER